MIKYTFTLTFEFFFTCTTFFHHLYFDNIYRKSKGGILKMLEIDTLSNEFYYQQAPCRLIVFPSSHYDVLYMLNMMPLFVLLIIESETIQLVLIGDIYIYVMNVCTVCYGSIIL